MSEITRSEMQRIDYILHSEVNKNLANITLYKDYITENMCENDYNDVGMCENCGDKDVDTYFPTSFSLDDEGLTNCFCRECLEYLTKEKFLLQSLENLSNLINQTKQAVL